MWQPRNHSSRTSSSSFRGSHGRCTRRCARVCAVWTHTDVISGAIGWKTAQGAGRRTTIRMHPSPSPRFQKQPRSHGTHKTTTVAAAVPQQYSSTSAVHLGLCDRRGGTLLSVSMCVCSVSPGYTSRSDLFPPVILKTRSTRRRTSSCHIAAPPGILLYSSNTRYLLDGSSTRST